MSIAKLQLCKVFFVLCLAWQNLVPPLHWARLWHDYCLSNLNFHIYNIAHKATKVKFFFNKYSTIFVSYPTAQVGMKPVSSFA